MAPRTEHPQPDGAQFDVSVSPLVMELVSATPSIIYLYDVKRGASIFQNRSLATMLGFDELSEPEWRTLIHPDDAERFPAHRARLATLGDGDSVTFEYRMRNVSGEWRWLLSRDTTFRRDEDGGVLQVIGSTSDITEQKRVEAALRESESRLRFAAESARFGIFDFDLMSNAWIATPEVSAYLGLPADRPLSWNAIKRRVDRDDLRRMVRALRRHGTHADGRLGGEFRLTRTADGERWILVHGRILFEDDPWGAGARRARRLSGIVLDTTERNEMRLRHEEQQQLLIQELNHRVKNTLAVVHSLATQTLHSAQQPADFFPAFEHRLLSLAAAHDLLTNERWSGAFLDDVAHRTIAPHVDRTDRRLRLSGPRVRLVPEAALALSMALHELATNATKHGALSLPSGHVRLTWAVEGALPGGDGAMLRVHWVERDGPPVTPPQRQGFGTRLLGRSLARQLRGNVSLRFDPDGLECDMQMPATLVLVSDPTP